MSRTTKTEKLDYLTDAEVDKLVSAAKTLGRYGKRDAFMIQFSFIHGLRSLELVDMTWDQIDLEKGVMHVSRVKGSEDSRHRLSGEEIRALRKLRAASTGQYVFVTDRGGPMTTRAFRYIVERAGEAAGFTKKLHPHMLRHGCGHHLADSGATTRDIQDYLGHVSIQNTVRYTKLSDKRFVAIARMFK